MGYEDPEPTEDMDGCVALLGFLGIAILAACAISYVLRH